MLASKPSIEKQQGQLHRLFKIRLKPMSPRDMQQEHRAATPLELLFDLVSVIAIAAAAAGLHHALAEAHYIDGISKYIAAIFAIWWAWMNYTWFASAYDNDDPLFRLLTMVIMAGALTLAAGISQFFEQLDFGLVVMGYVIIRLAMVALWLRAAKHDRARRKTTLSYAVGIALVQLYWVGLLLADMSSLSLFFGGFAIGIGLELSVPALAERHGTTPWHRDHIVERYGLLNIIVLGETLLAGSMALNQINLDNFDTRFVYLAISSLVILFSLWWLYFSREEQLQHKQLKLALIWGYGHLVIYLAGAAVGAGFALQVDILAGHSTTSILIAHYAVAIPIAAYFGGIWFVRDRYVLGSAAKGILPLFACLIIISPPLVGLGGVACLTVMSVYLRNHLASTQ
ncbi:low temperature requirement protein A [Alteromonas pelagimontana]|uniref:Low temperature requirement protein A n=1 Tax=Alteromonas pelagimontana TaxID=1858656 RepID=A0A6M4MC78_9ALTE|nr:low temperature requirement protein A [Alteromonas pelagimontana]QJR80155.1 low temperature requirement protein A [Alteromonas pelagimontana]